MTIRESISERNLPHWYRPNAAHFLTYRIFGSIPTEKMIRWREERAIAKAGLSSQSIRQRDELHKKYFQIYDQYLDNSKDKLWLARDDVASMIRENLYHHHGSLYHLIAFSIMGNHVHVLLQPKVGEGEDLGLRPGNCEGGDENPDKRSPLSRICHSLKSYTAHEANRLLGRSGQFWQHESYDHWVRDDEELYRIVLYICQNAVVAGLCYQSHEYRWSSAFDIFQKTGRKEGVLWFSDM